MSKEHSGLLSSTVENLSASSEYPRVKFVPVTCIDAFSNPLSFETAQKGDTRRRKKKRLSRDKPAKKNQSCKTEVRAANIKNKNAKQNAASSLKTSKLWRVLKPRSQPSDT